MIDYEKEAKEKISLQVHNKTKLIDIKLTPENLMNKKQTIAKIWNNFIEDNKNGFIHLLMHVGIDYSSLQKRVCPYCGRDITFMEFFQLNSPLGLGKAFNIWEDVKFKFPCKFCSGSH